MTKEKSKKRKANLLLDVSEMSRDEFDINARKAKLLLYDTIQFNQEIPGNAWLSGLLGLVGEFMANSQTHDELCDLLDHFKMHSKGYWEARGK